MNERCFVRGCIKTLEDGGVVGVRDLDGFDREFACLTHWRVLVWVREGLFPAILELYSRVGLMRSGIGDVGMVRESEERVTRLRCAEAELRGGDFGPDDKKGG